MTGAALVSGATGFIGAHLAKRLLADGWDVHVVVRPSSSFDRLDPVLDRLVVHVDSGDVTELTEELRPVELDACFHLATHFVGTHTPADVVPLVEANVAFSARLAEALAGRPDLVFVNTGTAWMHVGGEPYNPAALYAAMKQACKDLLRFYVDAGAFRALTISLYDTYGPDDPRAKLLSLLRRAQSEGVSLGMSSGHQLIDLVYVDDAVEAFLAAAATKPGKDEYPEYSVGSGSPVSLRELVALVERVTGRPVPVEWDVRPGRPKEMLAPWEFAPSVPGWAPRVPLEEGIRRTWTA